MRSRKNYLKLLPIVEITGSLSCLGTSHKLPLLLVLAGHADANQMLSRHQTARLVRVIPDLMQRDQLIGEISSVLRHILVLEAERVINIRTLTQLVMLERVQMWWHRVDRRERRVCGGFCEAGRVVGAAGRHHDRRGGRGVLLAGKHSLVSGNSRRK